MIWDMTLPEPRIIEVVEFWRVLTADRRDRSTASLPTTQDGELDDFNHSRYDSDAGNDDPDASDGSITGSDASNGENADDSLEPSELGDYLGLQLAGSLSTFLQIDLTGRNMDARPFEACPTPIALHVCRASRNQVSRRYRPMIDPAADTRSFYFDPRRDFLWLSIDASDEKSERLAELRQHYGQQVDLIENILIEETNWNEEDTLSPDYVKILELFRGLRVVRILIESYRSGDQSPRDPATYPALADELAERDSAVLGVRNWILEYIDQEGTIYRQVSLKV